MGGMNSLSHSSARIGFRMTMNAGDVAPEIPKTAIEMAMKVMQEKGTLERFMHIMQR